MNKGLTKAQEARKQKALDKLWNLSEHGLTTYRKLIDEGKVMKGKVVEVPKYKWNRNKYNRMNHEEQREYDKKMEMRKLDYRFYLNKDNDYFYEVPKLVFEYWEEKQKKEEYENFQ